MKEGREVLIGLAVATVVLVVIVMIVRLGLMGAYHYSDDKMFVRYEKVTDMPKGKANILVRVRDAQRKDIAAEVMLFKPLSDGKMVHYDTIPANRDLRIEPGVYGVVVRLNPNILVDKVKVVPDRRTLYNIGLTTGVVQVRVNGRGPALDTKYRGYAVDGKAELFWGTVNKMQDIVAGTYDINVFTVPLKPEKGVTIEPGKTKTIDAASYPGTVSMIVVDDAGKRVGANARLLDIKTKQEYARMRSGDKISVLPGSYDVECQVGDKREVRRVDVKSAQTAEARFVAPAPKK